MTFEYLLQRMGKDELRSGVQGVPKRVIGVMAGAGHIGSVDGLKRLYGFSASGQADT